MMRALTGVVFIIAGIACFAMFRAFFVVPAFNPPPNSLDGELAGPVSFFYIPIYVVCAFLVLMGLAMVWAFWPDSLWPR